jgi:hypothetical protein
MVDNWTRIALSDLVQLRSVHCYLDAGQQHLWAVVQSAARQVLALVVLVRVQAAQLAF